MPGVLTALCGVVLLVWVRWYLPRQMQRIRQKVVDRGGSPEALDKQMESRLWLFLVRASPPFGIFAIAAGLGLLLTE
jgi:hypothetical protein